MLSSSKNSPPASEMACERAAESGEIFVLGELARLVFLKLFVRAFEGFAEWSVGIFGLLVGAFGGAFALSSAALGAGEPGLGFGDGRGRGEPAVLGGDEGARGEHLVEDDAREAFEAGAERLLRSLSSAAE